jgi:hypothetical protein
VDLPVYFGKTYKYVSAGKEVVLNVLKATAITIRVVTSINKFSSESHNLVWIDK